MLFLHISDIHFKRKEVGAPDDPNLALRSDMISDVKKMRAEIGQPVDGVIISGDIAYYGDATEYDFAYAWLETKLCPAAQCAIENVFVVPGNHDFDRSRETGPAQTAARHSLRTIDAREVDAEVRRWMRDKASADVIFGPLENYNRFAAKFLCALRPYSEATKTSGSLKSSAAELPAALPFARRDVPLNDGSILRIWGFSTVIISDENDDKDTMVIDPAAAQIEVADGVTHMVVCHHPFNWLRNGAPFADRANKVAKLQLFGHEHTQRMDEDKRYLRVRAGALQPARDEPEWKPGYNWLSIEVLTEGEKRSLQVDAWVRMHENNQFMTNPDPDGNAIWKNNYQLPAWKSLANTPAHKPVAPPEQTSKVTMTSAQPQISVRSVTLKFFKLKEHEQRRVITQLALDRDDDRDLRDYELAISAVRRADEGGLLVKLDEILDDALNGKKQ